MLDSGRNDQDGVLVGLCLLLGDQLQKAGGDEKNLVGKMGVSPFGNYRVTGWRGGTGEQWGFTHPKNLKPTATGLDIQWGTGGIIICFFHGNIIPEYLKKVNLFRKTLKL